MKRTAHGNPILISNGEVELLHGINPFLESEIQDLLFNNPECLPISDIDESYNPVIPVCKELNTNAGPLDIFMITPNGDLIIIETKLWSNPESRRKVVAQILDYAKELAKWSYSDLQRELNKRLGTKGNILYEYATKTKNENILNEIDFVDAVSRNLRIGKFMLIIAGDGIREGAKNLTEFINKAGNLNFSLAMVELPIFRAKNGDTIIYPRTIVKTIEIQKINIEISEGIVITSEKNNKETVEAEISPEIQKRRDFYSNFWSEFVESLEFDDPECPIPAITKSWNLFLYPGIDKHCWISAYFSKSSGEVGVYFKFSSHQRGRDLKEALSEYREEMKEELGGDIIWYWDVEILGGFGTNLKVEGFDNKTDQKEIMSYFSEWMNKFVNVIRPRLKQLV